MRRTNIYFVPRNVGGNLVLNTLVLENLLKSLLIFSLERAGGTDFGSGAQQIRMRMELWRASDGK